MTLNTKRRDISALLQIDSDFGAGIDVGDVDNSEQEDFDLETDVGSNDERIEYSRQHDAKKEV